MHVFSAIATISLLIALSCSYEIKQDETSEAELVLTRIARSPMAKLFCYCAIDGQTKRTCYPYPKLRDNKNFKLCRRVLPGGQERRRKSDVKPGRKHPERKVDKKDKKRDKATRKSESKNPSGDTRAKPREFRPRSRNNPRKAAFYQQMQSDSPIAAAPASLSMPKTKSQQKRHKKKYHGTSFDRKKNKYAPIGASLNANRALNKPPASTKGVYQLSKTKKRRSQDRNAVQFKKTHSRSYCLDAFRGCKSTSSLRKVHQSVCDRESKIKTVPRCPNIPAAGHRSTSNRRKMKRRRPLKKKSDRLMVNDQPTDAQAYSTDYCREMKKDLCLKYATMNNDEGEEPCRNEKSGGLEVLDCNVLKDRLKNGLPKKRKFSDGSLIKPRKKPKRPTKGKDQKNLQKDQPDNEGNGEEEKTEQEKQDEENERRFQEEEEALKAIIFAENDTYMHAAIPRKEQPELICRVQDGDSSKCYKESDYFDVILNMTPDKLLWSVDLGKLMHTGNRMYTHMHNNPATVDLLTRKLQKVKDFINENGLTPVSFKMVGMSVTRTPSCRFLSEALPLRMELFTHILDDCSVLFKNSNNKEN